MSILFERVPTREAAALSQELCPICKDSSATPFLEAPDRFHGRKQVYDLVRCRTCNLVRLFHPPDAAAIAFHYGDGYHDMIVNAGETELARRWKRHRETVLSLKSGGAILDIGCSSGAFLKSLQSPSWQLYGVEISEEAAAAARKVAGAQVFVGDPLDAPFTPESFDVITCFHLLEHVYDPLELMKRARAWLRPGGFLYVVLPNINSWEARIFRSYWYGLELPRHLVHFSPQSLEQAAGSASLETTKLHTLLDDSFVEHSLHYVFEDLLAKVGVSKAPLSSGSPTPLLVKIIRKLFRLSFVLSLRAVAAIADRGASIEGVFVKHV